MKIKSISIRNHNVLGDLDLDFTDDNGNIVDTIIFAGENGCGKTSILEIINGISTYYSSDGLAIIEKPFKFSIGGENYSIEICYHIDKEIDINNCKTNNIYVQFAYNKQINIYIIQERKIFLNKEKYKHLFYKNRYIHSIFNYSKQEPVKNITAEDIDRWGNLYSKNSSFDMTQIAYEQVKQIFVNMSYLDSMDLKNWINENTNQNTPIKDIPKDIIDKRVNRFKNAFNKFFERVKVDINFDRIEKQHNGLDIYFKNRGKDVLIDNLSSGEKNLIIKSSYLLKDINSLTGAIILIDEPELNLHPNWQKEIKKFYQNIFTNENGEQTVQIFIATHSPFIVDCDLNIDEKLLF